MIVRSLIIAAALAMAGCSTLTEYGSIRKDSLRNDEGHVIGYKELLRNEQTGEVMAQVSLFTPVRGENGELIGYEEQARDGAIIRDLEGRRIGARFADLRSRGTNAKSRGLMIVFLPANAPAVAKAHPKAWELMASLSASDLRRIR